MGNEMGSAAAIIGILVFSIVGFLLYFLPSIIAVSKKKSNTAAIVVLNFFLGWSLIGWVVSLVWALSHDVVQQTIVINNQGNDSNH